MIALLNIPIGIGIIALDIAALWLLVAFFTKRAPLFVTTNAMMLAFALSLVAALGTLYYSEIVGVLPCKLCWYQRSLLYPQILVFAYGLIRKEVRAFTIGIVLSSLGLVVALYHISLPLFTSSIFCSTESELCLIQTIKIFGVITIPMMSASTSFMLLMLSLHGYRAYKAAARASNSTITT